MSTAPFKIVLLSDPAIDIEASDYNAFLRERDISALAFRDGEEPTIYHCRTLSLQERRDVRNKATDPDRHEAAFVRGLVRVSGLHAANGTRVEWRRESDKTGKERIVSDRDLETLFSETALQEVGAAIWHRSSLPLSPGSVVCFPLLDISRHALMAIRLPRADASATSASDKPQHEGQPPATPPSSSG